VPGCEDAGAWPGEAPVLRVCWPAEDWLKGEVWLRVSWVAVLDRNLADATGGAAGHVGAAAGGVGTGRGACEALVGCGWVGSGRENGRERRGVRSWRQAQGQQRGNGRETSEWMCGARGVGRQVCVLADAWNEGAKGLWRTHEGRAGYSCGRSSGRREGESCVKQGSGEGGEAQGCRGASAVAARMCLGGARRGKALEVGHRCCTAAAAAAAAAA
jgi:hypothetical protein